MKTNIKIVFTVTSKSEKLFPMVKTALKSFRRNNGDITPIVVWSGEHNEMYNWILNQGSYFSRDPIIDHTLSFKDQIKDFNFNETSSNIKDMYLHYPDYYNFNFIESDSLRIDLPLLFPDDEFIIYCDIDVLFIEPLCLPNNLWSTLKDFPIAACTRIANGREVFNNGFMILNIPKMKECYEDFKNFYISSKYSVNGMITTQGAYNEYFKDQILHIPEIYNWRAFSGINPFAKIIHFCGPKVDDYKKMMTNDSKYDMIYKNCLREVNSNDISESVKYYLNKWDEYEKIELKVFNQII